MIIVISKIVETTTNFKYLIRYLDKVIRPLDLVLPKISELVLKHLKLEMEIKIKAIN